MGEFLIAGLLVILVGSLPCYLLANHIEKNKHYSLFSGWDPSKITDEDAYAKLLCKGLRMFSLLFGLGGILFMLNIVRQEIVILFLVVIPLIPMLYYMAKAKREYGK